jgi:hypothetical protein
MSQDNPDTQRGEWLADKFGSMNQISAGKCALISWPQDVSCTAGFGPPSTAVLNELAISGVTHNPPSLSADHDRFVAG